MQDKPGRIGSKTLKVWLLKSERFGWKKLVGLSTIIFWERSLPHFILSLNELLSIFTSEPCKQRVYTERNKSLPKSCLYDQTWWIDWIEVLWKQTMVIIINCSLLLSPNNHYCLLWCFMRQQDSPMEFLSRDTLVYDWETVRKGRYEDYQWPVHAYSGFFHWFWDRNFLLLVLMISTWKARQKILSNRLYALMEKNLKALFKLSCERCGLSFEIFDVYGKEGLLKLLYPKYALAILLLCCLLKLNISILKTLSCFSRAHMMLASRKSLSKNSLYFLVQLKWSQHVSCIQASSMIPACFLYASVANFLYLFISAQSFLWILPKVFLMCSCRKNSCVK